MKATATTGRVELTLGPVLFNWEPATWRDFYFRIADEAPFDTVAVGEIVCSKRLPLYAEYLPSVLDRLAAAGKTVLLSSLILVTLDRERRQMEELARSSDVLVEANDVSCLTHLAGRPHAIGPFVNVYSEATARFLAGRGARRICLPPELPATSIAAIAAAVPETRIEVFAFGRVPLAISARCIHARLHGLTKDTCRFVCGEDADGLAVDTLDGEPFLAVNGVQTLSSSMANLVESLDALAGMGVASCRLSPQTGDMVAAARVFRAVLDGGAAPYAAPGAARAELARLFPAVQFADGFFHAAPGAEYRGSAPLP